MPVNKNKVKRVSVNLPIRLHLQVEAAAELARRSSANWLLNLIADHFDSLPADQWDELEAIVDQRFQQLPEEVKQQSQQEFMEGLKTRHPQVYEAFIAAQS